MKIIFVSVYFVIFYACCLPQLKAQYCVPFIGVDIDFQVTPRFVNVQAEWYPSWIEYNGGKAVYPKPLDPLPKWDHPFMKDNLPSAMHEDSYASIVSNAPGPIQRHLRRRLFLSFKG